LGLLRRPSSGTKVNTILTTAGTAGSLISNFVMRLVIARGYGPEPLGLYAIALGYQRVAGPVADAGLHYALLRRASTNQQVLRSGISLKMLIGFAIGALAVLPSLIPALDQEVRVAIVLGAAGVFGWSQLDCAQLWLRGNSRFSADLALHTFTSALRVAVALVALQLGSTVPVALAIYFLLPVLASVVVPLPWARPALPEGMLRASATSFGYRTLWLLWLNVDVLVLGWLLDIGTVGLYEAARSLAYPVLALADGAAIAVFQHLGAGRGTERDTARSLTRIALIGVVAAPLAGAVAYVALGAVYGPAFASMELAAVFTLLYVGFISATAATPYASTLLFIRPAAILGLTALDVVLSASAYAALASQGLVAVAFAACMVQALNLSVLVVLSRRSL
jgi:O-antigen/teichoic acid export membrane protein